MIRLLDRLATGRHVAITFLAALAVLLGANVFSTHFYRRTGGYGLLDLAGGSNVAATGTGYSPDTAYELLTRWGPAGRHDQLVFTLTLDVLVPILTFLFLALALLKLTRPHRQVRWLRVLAVALPVAYLISDYGENITILAMVLGYPRRLDAVAGLAGALWTAKTATSTLALVAVLLAALLRLTGWLRRAGSARGDAQQPRLAPRDHPGMSQSGDVDQPAPGAPVEARTTSSGSTES
jgi:hypothetical protein